MKQGPGSLAPSRLCAEYVALMVARRTRVRAWSEEAGRLAAMVGLPAHELDRLLHAATLADVASRRRELDRITAGDAS